tara:strand:+ start:2037 stop:2549 length:513 start_codon:yes stop_codon:yes gene_type:complete
MITPIRITEARVFRTTKNVKFFDIYVEDSNGTDLVEHSGRSTSPPNIRGFKQWYCHKHQTDNNRVLRGSRLFELFNLSWERPHWYVFLNDKVGALRIPVGCYHRSLSGLSGSLLVNHAIRDNKYDERKEFNPKVIWEPAFYTPYYFNTNQVEVDFFINHGYRDGNEGCNA